MTTNEQSTSNTPNPPSDSAKKLEGLIEMYNDEEWRAKQDVKLVAGIETAITTINNLTSGVGELLEKFYAFFYEVSNNPLVQIGSNSEGYTAPTQTPANRATRRARGSVKK